MLVDGFEGGEPTSGLMDWFAENDVSTIDIAVLTHVHYDHYNGLVKIEEDSRFHIELVYMYDPLTLKHGCDGSANGRAVKEDMDNAYSFIRKMQSHGTRVKWIDKGASFTLGDASFKVFRDQPREFTDLDDGNAYAFVNDGSLVLWSPETQILLGGDGCGNIKDAISYFGARVSGYDIAHHGNSCTKSNAEALKRAGCVVAWETCVERNGAGTTGWTEYGARRVKEQGIPVYMQNADIYITASDGKITFTQGNKSVSKYVLYGSIGEWVRNVKGWWFRLANGGYAVGWLKINGKWYFFDDEGYMVTGWRKVNGKWYYLDESGAMKTGWIFVNGIWYYLEESGAMHTGWLDWKGKRCYLEESGHCLVNCAKTIDGITYRFDKGGYATEISARSSLNGVDVASYQSGIDPSKMDTTDFAIVKFTQGTSYINPYSEKQYSSFKAAGKLLGAYHYASGKDAKAEAQYFVKALGDRVGECILALDWEGNQNSVFGSGNDVSWCKAFFDEVYRLTGVNALIYMSKSVCRKHDWSPIAPDHPLWCAQYKTNSSTDYQSNPWTDSNSFGAWQTDTIRQYSSHGRIAGYDSNIDINLAYLTVDQWKALASGKPQENPVDVAIGIAESYLGYREGVNNKTIFGDTMHSIQPSNMDANAPWCDAFVDFVILQMCKHFGYGDTTARKVLCGDFDDYTYNSVALYKKAGRWSSTPHRGDQIFFGGTGHTGIVTSVESGTIHTIEGNKGDEVSKCSYNTSSPSIIGYGRPRYDLITGVMTSDDMPLIKRGSKGDAVKKLQEILISNGYSCGSYGADGDFGADTESAVKRYQEDHGLTVDGIVGEKTWEKLM
jgi:GH25 family lysozyme M1 (1,4-beta-N-acetylmuramidase)/beta-lactamase superfamily II metal-dependent hydrolase